MDIELVDGTNFFSSLSANPLGKTCGILLKRLTTKIPKLKTVRSVNYKNIIADQYLQDLFNTAQLAFTMICFVTPFKYFVTSIRKASTSSKLLFIPKLCTILCFLFQIALKISPNM